jgi:hypothetical protein
MQNAARRQCRAMVSAPADAKRRHRQPESAL